MTMTNLHDAVEGVRELRVAMGELTPTDIWQEKDRWTEREARSREQWEKMDEDTRAVTFEIVDRALDRMRDRLDQWVPSALEISQGKYIDVTFRVLFTELEAEMKAREEITTRKIKEAAQETQRLLEDMSARKSNGTEG